MKTDLGLFIQRLKDRRGITAVVVVIMIAVLLGFAAFAVDIGHVMVVRNELQNAADASALAGARVLFPSAPSTTTPNWTVARTTATAAIQLNKSDNTTLIDCQPETGYWNLTRTPFGLQGEGISPGANDAPAVKVTVGRTSGNNGGPVGLFFGPILGTNFSSVSVQAVAVLQNPGTAFPGALIPFTISKQAYDYYNPTNGSPSPGATFNLVTPYPMGSDPGFVAGQWTSFLTTDNSASNIRNLIDNGNDSPIYVNPNPSDTCPEGGGNNNCIWIPPGVKESDYHELKSMWEGKDVTLPIIPGPIQGEVKTYEPVLGFVGFHIDLVYENGSHSYVSGHLLSNYYAGGTGPGGPNFGAYTPPVLTY